MIDNVSIKQRIEQFDLKHGVEEAVKSADGAFWLFPDGARREVHPYGLLDEPPDPKHFFLHGRKQPPEVAALETLKRQREYHATRLARLTEDFRFRKERMLMGDYQDEELAELNKLAKTVQAARHELSMVEEELRQRDPRNKAREWEAYAQQQRQERIDAVKGINI